MLGAVPPTFRHFVKSHSAQTNNAPQHAYVPAAAVTQFTVSPSVPLDPASVRWAPTRRGCDATIQDERSMPLAGTAGRDDAVRCRARPEQRYLPAVDACLVYRAVVARTGDAARRRHEPPTARRNPVTGFRRPSRRVATYFAGGFFERAWRQLGICTDRTAWRSLPLAGRLRQSAAHIKPLALGRRVAVVAGRPWPRGIATMDRPARYRDLPPGRAR